MSTVGFIPTWPFEQGGSNLIQRVDYDANSNAIYLGWSQAGVATSEAKWRIIQNTYDGSNRFTGSGFPNGSPSFTFIWDNRASLSYS